MIKIGELSTVPLSSIKISDRARQEMGDLTGLEQSIKERGLISPLAVKKLDDGTYQLLAGERRYIVLEKNKVEMVPVRIFPNDISQLEMKSIELAENFYRKNFEFWEEDKLIKEIHELQQQIHGVKAPGPGGTGWSMKDTANLVGVTDASVSTAIKRAELREKYPELFEECKTQKDATRVIKKVEEMILKEELSKKIEASKSDTKITLLSKSYVVGDFFEGVKKIPEGVIHLVEIDPPYAIKLKHVKRKQGESMYDHSSYNEIDESEYVNFMKRTFRECYRVMADHSWLVCWFAPEPWFDTIYKLLTETGFETTRMCGIWAKTIPGQTNHPELYLANAYEMFFYAWKGRPAINKQGRSNIFNFQPVQADKKTHPTERPIELMKEIYETFTFPGSRVLIPFLGSGNGILAAHEAGMTAFGFELSKSYRDSFIVKLGNIKS